MSSFFWNVRGFNKTKKHSIVRNWLQSDSLTLGCLLETRVQERKASRIISSVFRDWSSMSNYEFNPLERIWVVWRNNVRVTPVFKSGQIITCSVLVDGATVEFFMSFAYASNLAEERTELRDDLKHHYSSPLMKDKPWSIIGDFNEILDGEEHSKYVNSPSTPGGMRDFQDVVRYCSLVDMSSHGPLFTWCNKRDEDGLICKKLDRVLVNEEWNRRFPDSYSVFESGGCSAHLRFKIKFGPEAQRGRGPFKFSNILTTFPEFLPSVQNVWDTTPVLHHSTSAMFRFAKKT